ncbi:sporulation protein rmd1 [Microsporum canis]|uniref:YagE family protein n=1 Tax=Arthroderma otae (strain ATCC MYA-4605 / CBS 113480) TaxID=554155 RepID=C5FN98_ARTOC|nr:YagE family protein [Microsporum canis CBS 113480]EEQ31334.1 YagE family protein [Microsporum canis CBS 113480]
MNSNVSESSPLLRHGKSTSQTTSQAATAQPSKSVTFGPTTRGEPAYEAQDAANQLKPLHPSSPPAVRGPTGQPVLAALNSKLRRRHSQEPSLGIAGKISTLPKIGPQRTTKTTQKLKLLPNPVTGEDDVWVDDEIPRDVYSQITRIKEPTARRDAARLGKGDRERLPRVTAYCTANSYKLESVIRFLKSRAATRGTNPKLFDECVYSPYRYDDNDKMKAPRRRSDGTTETSLTPNNDPRSQLDRGFSDSELEVESNKTQERGNLLDMSMNNDDHLQSFLSPPSPHALITAPLPDEPLILDTAIDTPEVFLFDYGTVVIWGMTVEQETRFLHEVSRFANSVLSAEDMQVENFNFYYTRDYQARIYNDFISLRDPRSYMTKLAISHALSQSVKTSLFEDLVSETITATSPLPSQIAQTGGVNLTRRQINMQIGELFILRINIHLQGSVLDSPELMWAEPRLDPIYQAVRSYLEMNQRVGLLTERLDVIADLLAVLKDQSSHRHGEYLEWIVIILIGAEIVIAGINIIVDLYAGLD